MLGIHSWPQFAASLSCLSARQRCASFKDI